MTPVEASSESFRLELERRICEDAGFVKLMARMLPETPRSMAEQQARYYRTLFCKLLNYLLDPVKGGRKAQEERANMFRELSESLEELGPIPAPLSPPATLSRASDEQSGATETFPPPPAPDVLCTLAQDFQVLLTANDRPRMREETKRDMSRRMGHSPTAQEVRVRLTFLGIPCRYKAHAKEAKARVNAFLDNSSAGYRLSGTPPHLARQQVGQTHVSALYGFCFEPFVEVLTDRCQLVRVGVCAFCGRVYVRKPRNTRGTTCDRHCSKALLRFRRGQRSAHSAT